MFHLLVHQDFLPKETNTFMGRGAITYHSCLFTDGDNWGASCRAYFPCCMDSTGIRMARATIKCPHAVARQLPASQDPFLPPSEIEAV